MVLRKPQLVASKRNLQNNGKNRKKNSKRLSIVLIPERNLLQFPVGFIRSGVGHLLRSRISFPTIPFPVPPHKTGNSGGPPLVLTETAEDTIRYHFYLILTEKHYPKIINLLSSVHNAHSNFPIQSQTTLWHHMKRLGFSYKQTSKVPISLTSVSFVAQRTAYFSRLNELREANAHLYYHDDTWCNVGEEKRSLWIDEAREGANQKAGR